MTNREIEALHNRAAEYLHGLVSPHTPCSEIRESGNVIDGTGRIFDFEFAECSFNVEIVGPPLNRFEEDDDDEA